MAQFSGLPRTVWLTEPSGDRQMQLIDDFWFEDRAGHRWTAPAGTIIDGASIPQPLWATVGSPYTGSYRRASIVHDRACEEAADFPARRAADRMFYEACREGGCSIAQATLLYMGVRVGAHWDLVPLWKMADRGGSPQPRLARDFADKRVEADFQIAAETVLAQPPSDDPEEIEARVDAALSAVTGVPIG